MNNLACTVPGRLSLAWGRIATIYGCALALAWGVRPVTAETWLLRGGTVHTVSGPALPEGDVRIVDGQIAAVGDALPEDGARVVDVTGHHVYPGIIAANTTLGLLEINSVRATSDTTEVGQFTPDVCSWIAVNPDSELIPVARANGIAYFEPVPFGGSVSGQSGLMKTVGWTIEDMLVRGPVALHLDWPSLALNTTPKEEFRDKSRWKSLEDQAKERRERLREIDDFFLEAEAYARAARADLKKFKPVPAWEGMLPFIRGEVPLIVHADELRQIRAALQWARQRGYRIAIYGGRDAWRMADELAAAQVPVVYDCVFTLPNPDTASYDVHFRAPSVLHQAGVPVSFSQGGRHEAASVRNLPYAAAQAVAFGLPPSEALKGLTLYPAQILGVADRLGSIEPGKEATLLVCDGDLLDIRSRVKAMWIAGEEISLDSRHTRLYEKYRGRPKPAE